MIENDLCLGKGNCLKKIFGRFKHRTNLKILKPQGTFGFVPKPGFPVWGLRRLIYLFYRPGKCFRNKHVPQISFGIVSHFAKAQRRTRPKDKARGQGPRTSKAQGQGPRTRPEDKARGQGPRTSPEDKARGQGPRTRPKDKPRGQGPRTRPGPRTRTQDEDQGITTQDQGPGMQDDPGPRTEGGPSQDPDQDPGQDPERATRNCHSIQTHLKSRS